MPALYCASEALLRGLKDFVREGGVLVGTFKSCFANENVKVYSDAQPHILQECFGAAYDQFFTAEEMPLEVLYLTFGKIQQRGFGADRVCPGIYGMSAASGSQGACPVFSFQLGTVRGGCLQ